MIKLNLDIELLFLLLVFKEVVMAGRRCVPHICNMEMDMIQEW